MVLISLRSLLTAATSLLLIQASSSSVLLSSSSTTTTTTTEQHSSSIDSNATTHTINPVTKDQKAYNAISLYDSQLRNHVSQSSSSSTIEKTDSNDHRFLFNNNNRNGKDNNIDHREAARVTNTGGGTIKLQTTKTKTDVADRAPKTVVTDRDDAMEGANGKSLQATLDTFLKALVGLPGMSDALRNANDRRNDIDQLNVIRFNTDHLRVSSTKESDTVKGCRCEYPGELLYETTPRDTINKAVVISPNSQTTGTLVTTAPVQEAEKDEPENVDDHQEGFREFRWGHRHLTTTTARGQRADTRPRLTLHLSEINFIVKEGEYIIPNQHQVCSPNNNVVYACPGTLPGVSKWNYMCDSVSGDLRFGNRQLITVSRNGRTETLQKVVELPKSHPSCDPDANGSLTASVQLNPQPPQQQTTTAATSTVVAPQQDESEEQATSTNFIPDFFAATLKDPTQEPSQLPSTRPSFSSAPSDQPSSGAEPIPAVAAVTTLIQAPGTAGFRTVSGTVMEDTDNDNLGDTPLQGVTLSMYSGVELVTSTKTDAAGAFVFTVQPGEYVVVQSNLPGYIDVSSTGSAANIIMVDTRTSDVSRLSFVDELTSSAPSSSPSRSPSVSSAPSTKPSIAHSDGPSLVPSSTPSFSSRGIFGNVFEDLDNDNLPDEPIQGAMVGLFTDPDDGQRLIATTLTDATGAFSFVAPAGKYIVVQQNRPGMIDVSDSDGGNPNLISVDLRNVDRISGLFFLDEMPSSIPSVSVVPSTQPSFKPSISVQPSHVPSIGPSFVGRSIAGHVLEDTDNDDVGDEPLQGVVVTLLNEGTQEIVQSTVSDATGAFVFKITTPGRYVVFETNPPGYIDVTDSDNGLPNSIRVDLTNNFSVNGLYFVDELPSNSPSLSQKPSVSPSFVPSVSPRPSLSPSLVPSVSSSPTNVPTNVPSLSPAPSVLPSSTPSFAGRAISGRVLEDIDNDNVGEDPIPGVRISLYSEGLQLVASTVTDEAGRFSFSVPPGKYTVIETNLPGFVDVNDSDGGSKNAIFVDVSLTAPTKIVENLFFVDELPSNAPSDSQVPSKTPSSFPTVSPHPSLAPSIGPSESVMPSYQPSMGPSFEDRGVRGQVLEDIDNDGDGEDPIPGVLIGIYDSNFIPIATTLTDAAGMFSFSVPPGIYTVVQSNLPGYLDVRDSDGGIPNAISVDVTVSSNRNIADGLFFVDELPSNAPSLSKVPSLAPSDTPSVSPVPSRSPSILPSVSSKPSLKPSVTPTDSVMPTYIPTQTPSFADRAIVGKVLEDVDNDNLGEEPIPGVTVILYSEDFVPVATTITDQSGTFFFEVPPGKYTVVELNLKGYLDVNDSDGGLPNAIAVDSTVKKVVDGLFFVDELPSNAPSLSQVPTSTPSSQPSVSSKPSELPSVRPSLSVMPSIAPSMTPSLFPRLIAGKVLEDIDNDNVGEEPLQGAIVGIFNEQFVLVATTLTDETGTFQFVLPPGKYTVIEQNPPGYFDVIDSDGGLPNSIAVDTTVTKVIDDLFFVDELPSNAPSLSQQPSSVPSATPSVSSRPSMIPSVGPSISVEPSLQPSSQPSLFPRLISGKVLEDIDNDNIGEDPIPGVVIGLYNAEFKPVATTLTDESGTFSFVAPPGQYFVIELNKEGFLDVSDSDGGSPNTIRVDTTNTFVVDDLVFVDELPSNAPSESVVPSSAPSAKPSLSSAPSLLPSASPSLSVEPSLQPSSSPSLFPRIISGVVLEDLDNDDDGDEPIPGVLISLFDEDNRLVATTLTDNRTGRFSFVVQPGKYNVVEITPDGLFDVSDSDGGNPNLISVDVTVTKVIDTLVFVDEKPSNTPSTSSQPSLVPTSTPSLAPRLISGQVLEDVDNDNDGDEPMPAVLITLYDVNFNPVATTLTDQAGGFSFWVRPGRYTVIEFTPSGFFDVSDSDGGNPNIIALDVTNGIFEVSGLIFVNERPSNAPSLSSAPSYNPSSTPSVSVQPSVTPSSTPSVSVQPSLQPSIAPSVSVEPSLTPTTTPSLSSEPSYKPSSIPSVSVQPSSKPSSRPSVSVQPSLKPSSTPSTSVQPSLKPSSSPSVSVEPSLTPTNTPSLSSEPSFKPSSKPSVSVEPSLVPTNTPSLSSEPSYKPSSTPSLSVKPSLTPSYKPSESVEPSTTPSSTPSISVKPSLTPSNKPSESVEPSSKPSSTPSVSVEPSVTPSATPSISSAPSSRPSSVPSGSVFPSLAPSNTPSLSSAPSVKPSSTPSVSVVPSLTPSASPSESVSPSLLPTSTPSTSINPSLIPTSTPSTSINPSLIPTSTPSVSVVPTLIPTSTPSVSVVPSVIPTSTPSISVAPSLTPSRSPSLSSEPSSKPSSSPSGSVFPSSKPSSTPSLSVQPTSQPSSVPSVSSHPSTIPSHSPSLSSAPSGKPSSQPSGSVFPSSKPSSIPSLSVQPTSQPSSVPSVSSAPSLIPTSPPSTSVMPSYQPTSVPSVSSIPTSMPSVSPSTSVAPSSQPSSMPSGSSLPSSAPSATPSISAAPSSQPSSMPSGSQFPSQSPSTRPSISTMPTTKPSSIPSGSVYPSESPSKKPAEYKRPTPQPTYYVKPSEVPSYNPSKKPVLDYSNPTPQPTYYVKPSDVPSYNPSKKPVLDYSNPTPQPTYYIQPSEVPSYNPSKKPVVDYSSPTAPPTYSRTADTDSISLGRSGGFTIATNTCDAREVEFEEGKCSQGSFGIENVNIISNSDKNIVMFSLNQPFDLPKVAVWFKNPIHGHGEDYCWFRNQVSVGPFGEGFTARCIDGWATVSISGGEDGSTKFQHKGVQSKVPHADCQERETYEEDFQDFNPLKRCYWEIKIPCGCEGKGKRNLRAK